jgi:hypothetical protein
VHQLEIGLADNEYKASNQFVTYLREHPPRDPQMTSDALAEHQQKAQALGQKRQEMADQYHVHYEPFLAATRKLRAKAAELMTTIIKPVTYESRSSE